MPGIIWSVPTPLVLPFLRRFCFPFFPPTKRGGGRKHQCLPFVCNAFRPAFLADFFWMFLLPVGVFFAPTKRGGSENKHSPHSFEMLQRRWVCLSLAAVFVMLLWPVWKNKGEGEEKKIPPPLNWYSLLPKKVEGEKNQNFFPSFETQWCFPEN